MLIALKQRGSMSSMVNDSDMLPALDELAQAAGLPAEAVLPEASEQGLPSKTSRLAEQPKSLTAEHWGDREPAFYLAGGVVGCACPDCGGPMSVRLWLMMADCHQCGCSIELTEEHEREIHALLAHARQSQELAPPEPEPAAPTVKQVPVRQAPVKQAPVKQAPAQQPPQTQRTKASEKPIGVRKHLDQIKHEGEWRAWSQYWLKDTPAWIISAVLHMILIILLAMYLISPEGEEDQLVLSSRISELDSSDQWDQEEFVFEETPFEEASEFPVDEIAPQDIPEVTQEALEENKPDEKQLVVEPVDLAEVLLPSSEDFLPGTVGMFQGRDAISRGKLVKAYGGTDASERAVALGLKWLARVQEENGSWSLTRHQGHLSSPTGATGLGVLPFLGAGQTHRTGKYTTTVSKALNWICDKQKANGDLRSGEGRMYSHAICTLALCEAYAMTKDPSLRDPAQRALDFIVKAQHKEGGWRYNPGEPGDTSVVGWQLMALRSGQLAYLKVDKKVFEKTREFLDSVRTSLRAVSSDATGYAYLPKRPATHTMTAEGLLCRMYTGMPKFHEDVQSGVRLFTQRNYMPSVSNFAGNNLYYWYYATQVMHHYGGSPWVTWNNRMRELLIRTQETRGGQNQGSWPPNAYYAKKAGRIYSTSLALLTLEVYYRHLPLYDRPLLDHTPEQSPRLEQ